MHHNLNEEARSRTFLKRQLKIVLRFYLHPFCDIENNFYVRSFDVVHLARAILFVRISFTHRRTDHGNSNIEDIKEKLRDERTS